MRMGLRRAVLRLPPVNVEIGHHATGHELLAHKITGQRDRLRLAQLARQSQFDLPRQHRIVPALDGGHFVPQCLAVQPPGGRRPRQQDFRMHHPAFGEKILRPAQLGVI